MDLAIEKPTEAAHEARTDTNADLVARFQRGDTAAFERLVATNQGWLVRLIRRLIDSPHEAEDVLLEALVAVYPGLPRFRHESEFTTWATTITVNTCRSHRRRAGRWNRLRGYLRGAHRTEPQSDGAAGFDEAAEVRRAVGRLPEKYREPVVLHYFEPMSMKAVACALNLKLNTVEVRISRARRLLQTALTGRVQW